MTQLARVALALLAAAATSATLFIAADIALLFVAGGNGNTPGFVRASIGFLWPTAFVVALAHAIAPGLPAFLWLRRFGETRWWISLPAGFIVGALPYAILALPWRAPPANLVAAHIIQPFSWGRYAVLTGGLGLLGMAGGIAAWTTWYGLRPGRTTAAARP